MEPTLVVLACVKDYLPNYGVALLPNAHSRLKGWLDDSCKEIADRKESEGNTNLKSELEAKVEDVKQDSHNTALPQNYASPPPAKPADVVVVKSSEDRSTASARGSSAKVACPVMPNQADVKLIESSKGSQKPPMQMKLTQMKLTQTKMTPPKFSQPPLTQTQPQTLFSDDSPVPNTRSPVERSAGSDSDAAIRSEGSSYEMAERFMGASGGIAPDGSTKVPEGSTNDIAPPKADKDNSHDDGDFIEFGDDPALEEAVMQKLASEWTEDKAIYVAAILDDRQSTRLARFLSDYGHAQDHVVLITGNIVCRREVTAMIEKLLPDSTFEYLSPLPIPARTTKRPTTDILLPEVAKHVGIMAAELLNERVKLRHTLRARREYKLKWISPISTKEIAIVPDTARSLGIIPPETEEDKPRAGALRADLVDSLEYLFRKVGTLMGRRRLRGFVLHPYTDAEEIRVRQCLINVIKTNRHVRSVLTMFLLKSFDLDKLTHQLHVYQRLTDAQCRKIILSNALNIISIVEKAHWVLDVFKTLTGSESRENSTFSDPRASDPRVSDRTASDPRVSDPRVSREAAPPGPGSENGSLATIDPLFLSVEDVFRLEGRCIKVLEETGCGPLLKLRGLLLHVFSVEGLENAQRDPTAIILNPQMAETARNAMGEVANLENEMEEHRTEIENELFPIASSTKAKAKAKARAKKVKIIEVPTPHRKAFRVPRASTIPSQYIVLKVNKSETIFTTVKLRDMAERIQRAHEEAEGAETKFIAKTIQVMSTYLPHLMRFADFIGFIDIMYAYASFLCLVPGSEEWIFPQIIDIRVPGERCSTIAARQADLQQCDTQPKDTASLETPMHQSQQLVALTLSQNADRMTYLDGSYVYISDGKHPLLETQARLKGMSPETIVANDLKLGFLTLVNRAGPDQKGAPFQPVELPNDMQAQDADPSGFFSGYLDSQGSVPSSGDEHMTMKSEEFSQQKLGLCTDGNPAKGYIITGANMGGKSTYSRQCGLLCVMAQLGLKVPASKMLMTPLEMIWTRVGAHDSPSEGASTFMVEALEASFMLHSIIVANHILPVRREAAELQLSDGEAESAPTCPAGRQIANKWLWRYPRGLMIVDELGRGTSPEEGMDFAYGVISYFVNQPKILTLFATHFHELAEEALPGMAPVRMMRKAKPSLEDLPDSNEELAGSKGAFPGSNEDVAGSTSCTEQHSSPQSSPRRRKARNPWDTGAKRIILDFDDSILSFAYRVEPGIEPDSDGILLAKAFGFPSEVIKMAFAYLEALGDPEKLAAVTERFIDIETPNFLKDWDETCVPADEGFLAEDFEAECRDLPDRDLTEEEIAARIDLLLKS